jgi:hypothetical protein
MAYPATCIAPALSRKEWRETDERCPVCLRKRDEDCFYNARAITESDGTKILIRGPDAA